MNKEYLTPQDVALILQVNPKTVLKMIRDGKLMAIEIAGEKRKTFRILSGELDRFNAREYNRNKEVSE